MSAVRPPAEGGDTERAPRSSISYRLREAVAAIRERSSLEPQVGIVLGSGLAEVAASLAVEAEIPYAEIPHVPVPTVAGHPGVLVLGHLEEVPVALMRGRPHYYEGYSLEQVTFPVRMLRRLGVQRLVVTNAAGGLNPAFTTGDLMLIADHLSLPGMAGLNPLVGLAEPELGPRFLDLSEAYSPALRALTTQVAAQLGIALREGVYAMVSGPSYETPAEIRALQRLGADAVGMSTVPEVIVARQEGMEVLGISCITDVVVGPEAAGGVTHTAVLAAAERSAPRLTQLLRGVLARLRARSTA